MRAPPPLFTVLQIIPTLDAGGAEQTTLDVARAIYEAGGKPIVATKGGRLVEELKLRGASVVLIDAATKNPAKMLANASRLAALVKRERVDVIHARSRAPAWSGLLAARMALVPFVTTFHGSYRASSGPKRFYNSVMARGDVVIANSMFTAAHIREAYPWAEERLVTIPRGTDMVRFDPAAVSAERIEAVRAELGLEIEMRPIVLLPGRLTPWKGQRDFIEAMRLLRAAGGPPALGLIVGDPQGREDYAASLRAEIVRAGLKDHIRLGAHMRDMPAAYVAADVVVSASTEPEAFGRVAVEAQAMGRVIVATDHGGSAETVMTEDGARTGYRVPPRDPAALADAIGAALSLPLSERSAIIVRAQEFVRARYSLDAMCAATLGIYHRLIAVRKQR